MKNFPRYNFTVGSRLFLNGIALVYLIAFASLWLQVEGLFGSEGIMPIERYFDQLASQENHWSYILRYPSLLWLDHFLKLGNTATDPAVHAIYKRQKKYKISEFHRATERSTGPCPPPITFP